MRKHQAFTALLRLTMYYWPLKQAIVNLMYGGKLKLCNSSGKKIGDSFENFFLLGDRQRDLLLAEHEGAIQLLHRLPEERVQDEGTQELHRVSVDS